MNDNIEAKRSYLELNVNGTLQEEIQRIKNLESPTNIMLLWNNVTVLVLEKAELFLDVENNINEHIAAQLKIYGQRTVELFEDILDTMKIGRGTRRLSAYREYMAFDNVTLEDVAPNYGVSRERIRQFVKCINKNIFGWFKKQMLFDNDEFNDYVRQLASVFEKMGYNIIPLIAYGWVEIGNRKKQAILNTLFGTDICEKLLEKSRLIPITIKEENNISRNTLKKWAQYRSKICYPCEWVVDNSIPVTSYEKKVEYEFEKRFYKKLQKFEGINEIIKNPDIVYYSTSKTNHRPNFLLRLEDGTSVLVLLLPTVNMAYIYNIQRCNELHRFCRENGYGYLITDNRENTLYDMKNRAVDPELVECLNTILKKQTMIFWRNIKEIKQTRAVSNADIAAYVLQNKLHFTMEPFCIKYKQEI